MNIKKIKKKIEGRYKSYGVKIKLKLKSVIGDNERFIFRIKLKSGTQVSLIFDRAYDIRTALRLSLLQPFRDGLNICLAVSKNNITQNSLMKMLTSWRFRQSRYYLPIALGYNLMGEMVFADLANMPHAMYAGSTNSGKSIGLICLTSSLIKKLPVRNVNLLLFDIGANTLELFSDVPHLSYPLVKDADTGMYVIKALVEELERRIKLDKDELRNLPAIVCVIDEYVSFINNIENRKQAQKLADGISNLLRRGRHAKIHMVLSTQDPTLRNMKVDVGNITTRMAFTCAKFQNSVTILGEGGAEKLPGKGAMLYKSNDYPAPVYLQGAYISPDETYRLVNYINSADHDLSNKFIIPEFDVSEQSTQEDEDFDNIQERSKEMAEIIMWILEQNTISASQIKDRFPMGNRVNEIMVKLFDIGLITEKFANQPRKVLPQSVGDISEDVVKLLENHGYRRNDVSNAINKRSIA